MRKLKTMWLLLAIFLLAPFAAAGWNDLALSSAENMLDARQGRAVSLSLTISNEGASDGYAVYVLNITLYPPPCINGGNPVTSIGGIVCPETDSSCRLRFRNSGTSMIVNFTNLTTDASCANGMKDYRFSIAGNVELVGVESRWSAELREKNTSTYIIRFMGADVCGDGVCANASVGGNESCVNCAADCGRCIECSGSARACRNNSIYSCVNGFYTRLAELCAYGCEETLAGPECRRLCAENETLCADAGTLQTCRNNAWVNTTCLRGCANNACETDLCKGVACPDTCAGNRAHSYGSCDPATGSCTYFDVDNCSAGCNGAVCAVPLFSPTPASTPGGLPGTGSYCGAIGVVLLAAFSALAFSRKGPSPA